MQLKPSIYPSQQVLLDDGSSKNIEDIKIGDIVHIGGKVLDIKETLAYSLCNTDDIKVSSGTIIKDKYFMYIEDKKELTALYDIPVKTYSIITEKHKLVLNNTIIGDSTGILNILGISKDLIITLFLHIKRVLKKH